ncbi:MAG: hypothetical protein CMN78_04745 [Spirochaetales bacterium]|nr:hypothetical protein [Spirochaetales bacterium]
MTYFEGNAAEIAAFHPSFMTEIVAKYEPDNKLKIVETQSGLPTARIHGVYLHSLRDPAREAERVLQHDDDRSCVCCVFFGFGLGYFVEEFLKRHPNTPVVIIEPNSRMFLSSLAARDLRRIFSADNISLLLDVEPEAIATVLNQFQSGRIRIVSPRSLEQTNKNYFVRARAVVDSFLSRREINKNTLKRFGKRWVKNFVGNMSLLLSSQGISSLANTCVGTPAIVLAAGPSLDQVLPSIAEVGKRCITIAVDTSYRALERFGANPDFLVVVDPQYWNTRHLDGCDTSNTLLVSESSTFPSVLRREYRGIFFGDSLFPLGAYIEGCLGGFGKIGAGGSVATSAWDLARHLGCKPIFTAGLDLGYPSSSTHFNGGRFEELILSKTSRLMTSESGSFRLLNDAQSFFVPANNGSRVLTDRRLITYKWWFENQLKIYPEVESFTLSKDGVKLDGMPLAAIEDILSLPAISGAKASLIQVAKQPTSEEFVERGRKLIVALEDLHVKLRSFLELAKRGATVVSMIDPKMGIDLASALDELNTLDAELLSSASKDIVGFLIHDTAYAIVEQLVDGGDGVMDHSHRLYEELTKASEFHLSLVTKAENEIRLKLCAH